MSEQSIERHAEVLAEYIDRAFVGWLRRCVFDTARAQGVPLSDELQASTENMAAAMHRRYVPEVKALLAMDVDDQRTTPMAILRQAAIGATQVLAQYGVPARERDDYLRAQFPDDAYGLAPATFADIDPELAEPGLAWGAAKAFVHKERHRR